MKMEAIGDISGFYEALSLPSDASLFEAKQSYRRLAKTWHPDRFLFDDDDLQKEAEERMKGINEAYRIVVSQIPTGSQSNPRNHTPASRRDPGVSAEGMQTDTGWNNIQTGIQEQIRTKAKAEALKTFGIMSFLVLSGITLVTISSILIPLILPYAVALVYG